MGIDSREGGVITKRKTLGAAAFLAFLSACGVPGINGKHETAVAERVQTAPETLRDRPFTSDVDADGGQVSRSR